MVQKVQDPKENEENAICIPVILNGLLTDGNNVLILVVLKVKVMGVESFTFCYTPSQNVWSVLVCMVQNGPSRSRGVTPMMMSYPSPSSSRLVKPFLKSYNFFIMKKYLVSEIF